MATIEDVPTALVQMEAQQPSQEHEDSPLGGTPRLYLVSDNATPQAAPAPAPVLSCLRAARYLQAGSAKAARAVTR